MYKILLIKKIRYWLLFCMMISLTSYLLYGMISSTVLAEEMVQQKVFSSSNGVGNGMVVDKISLGPELEMKTIRTILEDPYTQLLWFATDNLFASYNGYDVKVYKHHKSDKNSLAHDVITKFYQDSKGRLWIGTLIGVDCFVPETGRFVHYQGTSENEAVTSIFEDRDGMIWIGTLENSLNHIDEQSHSFVPYHLPVGTVNVMYQDRDGILWLGTDTGILSLNKNSGETVRYSGDGNQLLKNSRGFVKSIGQQSISTIWEDRYGVIWFGDSEGGISRLKQGTMVRYEYRGGATNNAVKFLYENDDRYLWMGGEGAALHIFDRQNEEFVSPAIDQGNYGIYERGFSRYDSPKGITWIGRKNGLFRMHQSYFANYNKSSFHGHGLGDDNVSSIYKDADGITWVGTTTGLNRLDMIKETCVTYGLKSEGDAKKTNMIKAIIEDTRGRLWLGTQEGVVVFDKARAEVVARYTLNINGQNGELNNEIMALYQDRSGVIWVGTLKDGLWTTNEQSNHLVPFVGDEKSPLMGSRVSSIFEDSHGDLWVGFRGEGLVRIDKKTGSVLKKYQFGGGNVHSLSDDKITCLGEDGNHNVLVGTLEGGLNQFDPSTGEFIHYREESGLPSDTIAGITRDEQGAVWVICNGGVAKQNLVTGKFRVFDAQEGLLDSWFYLGSSYGNSKELLFGGPSGLHRIVFATTWENESPSSILITDIKKRDESVLANAKTINGYEVNLSYKDYSLSFEYAAVNLNNPKKIQYAYQLEGVDADWVYSGTRRYASYTNLDGGEYVFRVKARNGDGAWSEQGLAVTVKVEPPPWKTSWAYLTYILIGASAVYGIIRWRIHREQARLRTLKEWNLELEEKVENRTRAVRNLLNNAGQGFLSFGTDLVVEAEYSNECVNLLGNYVAGHYFPSLIYPNDKKQVEFLHKTLSAIFRKSNKGQQQVYLSLLPQEIILYEYHIQLHYKLIGSNDDVKIMVILTNVTEQRSLERKMQVERQRNLMVAKVAARYDEFAEGMRAFSNLYIEELVELLAGSKDDEGMAITKLTELLRRIHTFKGEFAQFEMGQTVTELHKIENLLQEAVGSIGDGRESGEVLLENRRTLPTLLQESICEDMGVLVSLLGEQFFDNEEVLKVKKKELQAVEQAIAKLTSPDNRGEILSLFGGLRKKDLKSMLAHYPDYVLRLGERIGKMIVMEFGGDTIMVDPDKYYALTKVLCHVFRNGVDHGIELVEERTCLGKNPCGNIYCEIKKEEHGIRITIEDDGAGVDLLQVQEKAVERGLISEVEALSMSEGDILFLLFQDGFSTKEEINFVSGRGVGLPAVKEILEEMGGRVEIQTRFGFGTTFIFVVPLL